MFTRFTGFTSGTSIEQSGTILGPYPTNQNSAVECYVHEVIGPDDYKNLNTKFLIGVYTDGTVCFICDIPQAAARPLSLYSSYNPNIPTDITKMSWIKQNQLDPIFQCIVKKIKHIHLIPGTIIQQLGIKWGWYRNQKSGVRCYVYVVKGLNSYKNLNIAFLIGVDTNAKPRFICDIPQSVVHPLSKYYSYDPNITADKSKMDQIQKKYLDPLFQKIVNAY